MIDTSKNKNFCPAPWISIYVEPNGRVDNCCVGKNNLGNLSDAESATDILLGDVNLGIQQAMLDNQTVDGCSWCHKGTDHLQARFLRQFPDTSDPIYQQGKFSMRYLDARWSNTCNLACVYCTPTFSSLWSSELGDRSIKIEKENKNTLLDYVLDNVENLEEIYLAGGEPTLMRENELLLTELSKRNPNVKLLINTNLLNNETKIYQQLLTFPNATWLVSFEDMNERYEYLRYPGNWKNFSTNLLALKQQVPVEQIHFNMVYLSLNAMTIWDSIDWLFDHGFKRNMNLALINNGVFDSPYNPSRLSMSFREQVLERIAKSDYSGLHSYQNITDSLALPTTDHIQLLQTLAELDQRRGLDSRKVFPEIYNSIESTR